MESGRIIQIIAVKKGQLLIPNAEHLSSFSCEQFVFEHKITLFIVSKSVKRSRPVSSVESSTPFENKLTILAHSEAVSAVLLQAVKNTADNKMIVASLRSNFMINFPL